jgi:hypothetical protein
VTADAAGRLERFRAAEDDLVRRVRTAVDAGSVRESTDRASGDGDSP